MSNFKPQTYSSLILFAIGVAARINYGIKHGLIGSSGKDKRAEVKEFLRLYTPQLSREYGVNVRNIRKTKKQHEFVVDMIVQVMGEAA